MDISLRSKSLELLQEVKKRLESFEDDRLVIKNMRTDCTLHLEYFNSISLEALSVNYVNHKVSEFREEINSTILPSEKLPFQKELTELLEEKHQQFPENIEFSSQLAFAYNDLAWLLLRLDQPKQACSYIEKGLDLDNSSLILKCNLAHSYLLDNDAEKAIKIYIELLDTKKSPNDEFKDIIRKDLDILIGDGADKILLEDTFLKLTI
jgi:tetratricopeptide (TPR) repeat protein